MSTTVPPTIVGVDVASKSWVVQELEGRGRGVVSTESIPSGATVLLESRPLVAVVHASRSRQVCANCFCLRLGEVSTKFLPQPVTCTTCNQVAWCSAECKNQSIVLGSHPSQICLAYKRLADRAEEEGEDFIDQELQCDARLLFHAYLFRRYRPEEFARWSLLCSVDTAAIVPASSGLSSASATTSAVSPASAGAASTTEAEEEERIEQLHDVVVDCLQFAAKSIAEPKAPPTPNIAPPPEAKEADPLAPPPALALPSLAKQFTDLHISHPSDDLTESLASDADLAVTRSLYLKTKCNGFALMAPNDKMGNRQTPRGYAIYTNAAMVNHSCIPNVARFDKIDARDVKYSKAASAAGTATSVPTATASSSTSSSSSTLSSSLSVPLPTPSPVPSPADCDSSSSFTPLALELRTMFNVPAYTELTTSYVPIFWERRDRQEQLRAEYGFKCRCERCRLEKEQERKDREEGAEPDECPLEAEEDGEDEEGEDEDEDEDEDGEDDEDANAALSDDDAEDAKLAQSCPLALTRGELNIYVMKYICPSKNMRRYDGTREENVDRSIFCCFCSQYQVSCSRETMECNICGKTRTDAQFHRQLAKEFGLRK